MRKFFWAGLIIVSIFCVSCAPVTLTKCIEDYKYNGDKLIMKSSECVTQTPEKMPPLHLKHQELYE
jgi:hypothetical protein